MSIMRCSLFLLAGFSASTVMLTAVPARAGEDGWRRHEGREHREHEWREHREHEWRERQGYGYGYGYAPPPVYYVQPQYYRPPFTYYRPW